MPKGSPLPNGKSDGNAIVAKNGVLNSDTGTVSRTGYGIVGGVSSQFSGMINSFGSVST